MLFGLIQASVFARTPSKRLRGLELRTKGVLVVRDHTRAKGTAPMVDDVNLTPS